MIVLPQATGRQPVRALAFSPDGLTLACASRKDVHVTLWDLVARENRGQFEGQKGTITSIAFSPDGRLLASATSDGNLWVWSLEGGGLVMRKTWAGGPAHAPAQVVFSPDGSHLATTLDHNPMIGGRIVGRPVTLIPVSAEQPPTRIETGTFRDLTHLAYNPDGSLLAVGSFDRYVSLWDVATKQRAMHLFHGQKVHYVAFSPDGKSLAAGNPQGLVKLWDAATGRKLLTLKGQATPLRSMCFSPDGRVLMTAGGEGIVTFWDVQSGKSRTAFDWGIGEVFSVCFAADGMRAAAGGVGKVVIWDVDGWEV